MKRTVIKLGGALLDGDLQPFWQEVERLQSSSDVVLVHGGGPQTTALAERLGHTPTIVHGRRVTTPLDLDILKWVIRGELNLKLTAAAHAVGVRAVGLSGADGGTLSVQRRPPWTVDGEHVDFGEVGDAEVADTTVISALLQAGVVPVLCPPGVDRSGDLFNINADTIALEIALALGAEELLLLTGSGGVLDREGQLLKRLDRVTADRAVDEGWIAGGMKVKTDIGFKALDKGVKSVWIADLTSINDRSGATRLLSTPLK